MHRHAQIQTLNKGGGGEERERQGRAGQVAGGPSWSPSASEGSPSEAPSVLIVNRGDCSSFRPPEYSAPGSDLGTSQREKWFPEKAHEPFRAHGCRA